MESTSGTHPVRCRATPHLEAIIQAQGRRKQWLADQIGVSRPHVSHVIARRRTLPQPVAERVAALLNVPFFIAFELPEERDMLSEERSVA